MKQENTGALAQAIFHQAMGLKGALTSEEMKSVWFVNEGIAGSIRLWEGHIVEMEIPALGFWAHFDGNDAIVFYDHIHAFFEVLHHQDTTENWLVQTNRPMKLLIICSSGISSSMAAAAINRMAVEHGWNIEADSCAAIEASGHSRNADVVLYAPQAAAAFRQLPEKEKRHSGLIRPLDFALMNSKAMVRQALQLAS